MAIVNDGIARVFSAMSLPIPHWLRAFHPPWLARGGVVINAADASLPSWKILLLGLVKPGTYLQILESSRPGIVHFYRTAVAYAMLPLIAFGVVAFFTEAWWLSASQTENFHLGYSLSVTAIVGILFYAPVPLWFYARCMYGAMYVVGLHPSREKTRIIKTGWYVATTQFCIWCWTYVVWLLGMIIGGALGEDNIPVYLDSGIFLASIGLGLWVAASAYAINAPARIAGTGVRAFLGAILGSVLFLAVWIPVWGFLGVDLALFFAPLVIVF